MGSNGSVIPFFLKKKKKGVLPITHKEMTRFNISLQGGVDMVIHALENAYGSEIFVPKIPSYNILDVAEAICRLIPSTFTGPIDIGTGQETSVLDLADALGRSSLPIKDVLNEPDSLCADITQLRSLGWSPTINILERIRENAIT